MKIERTVTVKAPVRTAFDYLSDFATTTEWDPGTVSTVRVAGDGGVGTTYRNTSRFLGRETVLVYVVEERASDERIRLRGENKTVVSVDTMTLRHTSAGTEVTYTAEFTFKGPSRIVAPLLRPAFTRLGNDAAIGLRSALDGLVAGTRKA
jgi:carbon monoxide dehydrogenase subunit G